MNSLSAVLCWLSWPFCIHGSPHFHHCDQVQDQHGREREQKFAGNGRWCLSLLCLLVRADVGKQRLHVQVREGGGGLFPWPRLVGEIKDQSITFCRFILLHA